MEIHLSARFIKRTPNKHTAVAPNTKRFQMENDIDNELLYSWWLATRIRAFRISPFATQTFMWMMLSFKY